MADIDLIERLNTKADVMEMGERIAWGSDTALMREAATALSDQAARIAELETELYLLRNDRANKADQIYHLETSLTASRAECEGLRAAVVPAETLRQLDMLFERTTQGSWRTYQNGVHPVEVGGMGSGDDYAICTHGPKSYANADWIATMHDEWPRIRAALSQKETGA